MQEHQFARVPVSARVTALNCLELQIQSKIFLSNRVRKYFGKFWKVMEIDNAIFQDLESFGNERFFKLAMEKLWTFWGEILDILKWI